MAPLTWETAADWDAAQSEQGVIHEVLGDVADDTVVQQGFPSYDQGGGSLNFYFSLDESTGPVADAVTGNTGTVNGATLDVTGLFGTTAASFDGVDDEIVIGHYPELDIHNGDYTILVGFNSNSTTNSDPFYTKKGASGYADSSAGYGATLAVAGEYNASTDGEFVFYFGDGSNDHWHQTGWVPTAGAFHIAAVVYDQTNGEVRVHGDGAQQYSAAESATPNDSNHDLIVGAHYDSGGTQNRIVDGAVDALAGFSRAIGAAEANSLTDGSSGRLLTTKKVS